MWISELVSLSLAVGFCETNVELMTVETQLEQVLSMLPEFEPIAVSDSRVTGFYTFNGEKFKAVILPRLYSRLHVTMEGGKNDEERHQARISLIKNLTKHVHFDLTTGEYAVS